MCGNVAVAVWLVPNSLVALAPQKQNNPETDLKTRRHYGGLRRTRPLQCETSFLKPKNWRVVAFVKGLDFFSSTRWLRGVVDTRCFEVLLLGGACQVLGEGRRRHDISGVITYYLSHLSPVPCYSEAGAGRIAILFFCAVPCSSLISFLPALRRSCIPCSLAASRVECAAVPELAGVQFETCANRAPTTDRSGAPQGNATSVSCDGGRHGVGRGAPVTGCWLRCNRDKQGRRWSNPREDPPAPAKPAPIQCLPVLFLFQCQRLSLSHRPITLCTCLRVRVLLLPAPFDSFFTFPRSLHTIHSSHLFLPGVVALPSLLPPSYSLLIPSRLLSVGRFLTLLDPDLNSLIFFSPPLDPLLLPSLSPLGLEQRSTSRERPYSQIV